VECREKLHLVVEPLGAEQLYDVGGAPFHALERDVAVNE
jgi:hypothetical protein